MRNQARYLSDLNKIIELDPTNANALYNRGRYYEFEKKEKDLRRALEDYARAKDYNADYTRDYLRLIKGCPICERNDAVRKVSAVYSSGHASGAMAGPTFEFFDGDMGATFMSGSFSSRLANLLAPQQKPSKGFFESQKDFESRWRFWQYFMEIWSKLYYCSRDDVVFDPEKPNTICKSEYMYGTIHAYVEREIAQQERRKKLDEEFIRASNVG
jgi:tetratricopeptide (TPR) repeat protein